MTIGQRIREVRMEKGLSQRQLAGEQITRNMLSQIEHDLAAPSLSTLQYLSRQLEVPVSVLLGESVPDSAQAARRLMDAGQYAAALDLLQSAAGPLLCCMEECYQKLGDFEKAYHCVKLHGTP